MVDQKEKVEGTATVFVRGKERTIKAGEDFVCSVAEIARQERLSEFVVRVTDKSGNTSEVDLDQPPQKIETGTFIEIFPYDKAG